MAWRGPIFDSGLNIFSRSFFPFFRSISPVLGATHRRCASPPWFNRELSNLGTIIFPPIIQNLYSEMYNALICIFFIIITLLFSKIPKEPFVQAEIVNQKTSVTTITYYSRIVSVNRIRNRKSIVANNRFFV